LAWYLGRVQLRWIPLLWLAIACNAKPGGTAEAGATATPQLRVYAATSPRLVVDAATAPKCVVTYSCGISHPGLGSTHDVVSVDLGTCTKTVSHARGPYREDEPPPRELPPPPPATKLAADTCSKLRAQLCEIHDVDLLEARESARMDSTACTLDARCPDPVLSVQRQSLDGSNRVVRLIVALQSAR